MAWRQQSVRNAIARRHNHFYELAVSTAEVAQVPRAKGVELARSGGKSPVEVDFRHSPLYCHLFSNVYTFKNNIRCLYAEARTVQIVPVRERLFTMRMSADEWKRAEAIAAHFGQNVASLFRMLLLEKERELATQSSKSETQAPAAAKKKRSRSK